MIPVVIALLRAIHHYYDGIEAEIGDARPLDLGAVAPPILLVTLEDWNSSRARH